MAQAILAALFHRQRTGEGQFVEVPMLECVTSFNLVEHFYGHVYDPPTGQWGYTRVANPDRKPFPTKDGYIGLLPYTDQQWDQFFELAGWGETFGKDPRFSDYRTRAAAHPRALRPGRRGDPDQDHRRVAGAAEAAADPGGADEPAGRPAGRSAPGGGRLLPALRASGRRRLCSACARR